MKRNSIQLWLHNHYTQIRHWLLVVLGVVLLLFSIVSIANQNKLIAQVKTLSAQNKDLSQDNKSLNEQNKTLAKDTQKVVIQNRTYTACLAEIFARYTNDFVPIQITNLDTCSLKDSADTSNNTAAKMQSTSQSKATSTVSHSNTNQSASSAPSENSQSSGGTPTPTPEQPDILQRLLSPVKSLINGL